MKIPHVLKIFYYMYQLSISNLKVYMSQVAVPCCEEIRENSVHWVGHATTVINLNGKIIVTDPVSGNLGFIKRLVRPSIKLKNVDADYLIITHKHMDHLKYTTLLCMNKQATVIAPSGIKSMLKIMGFKNIVEMKADGIYKDAFIEILCIKANHKGNRYPLFGSKQSNSYLISSGGKSILFAGDTSDTTVYKNITADAAIMPVGCYKPDDYLKMHCSPEQSFNMFKMMNCKFMIPIHYKTYILAQDKDKETISILGKLNDGSIKIIDIGQTVSI